jgi:uncharacterized protein (TIGR02996 family)
MSRSKTATVNGQPLSYWTARYDDKNRQVRDAARAALLSFRCLPADEWAAFAADVPAFFELFWQPGSRPANEGWWCLRIMGPLVLPSLPAFLDTFRGKPDYSPKLANLLLDLARKGREAALPILLDYLRNVRNGHSVFRTLADSAHKLGPDAAVVVPFLEDTFGNGHNDFRDRAIAAALGRVGLGVSTVIKGLTHKDTETRRNAARSLGQLGAAEAVPHLIKALDGDDYSVAAEAAESLGKLGEAARPAVEPLTEAAKSRSKNLRSAATAALKLLPPATAEDQAAWTVAKARQTAASSQRTNEHMVRHIIENPDDITARLVYADWLDEHDNPRGEFIRVQCRLAELAEDESERPALEAREKELWAAHGKTWRKEAPAWPHIVRFRRGFAEEVQCPPKAFLKQGAGLFRRAPIISLTLRVAEDHLAALAACPLLAHLRSLRLWEFSAELAASPHLANLTCLDLAGAQVGDAVCEAIAASPHLARLTRLHLNGNRLGDHGVSALARSPHLSNLNTLILGANPFGPEGVRSLADSPRLANLRELGLWYCGMGPEGAEALAAARHLANLRTLNLDHNPIGDRGVLALVRSRYLTGLKSLRVDTRELGAEAKQALIDRFGKNE